MLYRKMGKCADEVSILGFGCMRLPLIGEDPTKIDEQLAIPMLRNAIDAGGNYVDTAYPYHSSSFEVPGESEPFVGRALQDGYRDKVKIATKLPPWLIESRDDMARILDHQLERLQTDCIDYYLLHALNKNFWAIMQQHGALEFLDKVKADGKIKHAGFSYHEGPELFRPIVDAYDWDFCQIQYNYLDENTQAGKAGLEYAAEKGLGVVVMEPLRGGNLAGKLPEEAEAVFAAAATRRSHAEWALRWIWNDPRVSTVLSGMTDDIQAEENLQIAAAGEANSLSEDELARVDQVKQIYRSKQRVPCTKCGYCMPCPDGVKIPDNLSLYNEYHLFDSDNSRFLATALYNMTLAPEAKADQCTECGQCLQHCPQQIAIPDELKRVVETFAPPE
jgi:predicted aldo/keto reductase-like oxidoreductase